MCLQTVNNSRGRNWERRYAEQSTGVLGAGLQGTWHMMQSGRPGEMRLKIMPQSGKNLGLMLATSTVSPPP